jgi:hypothetical protein
MNIQDARVTASAFHQSGMFPNLKNEAQAFVLILAGAEMGVGAMEAVQGITLIQGKPTMSANLLASLVKRHPRYDYRVVDHSDTTCRIEFFQDGEPTGVSEFTLEDARKAGLGGNQTWKKYTAALLFARALTQGVRWYAPDVTSSAAYTPEELGGEAEPVEVVQNPPENVQTPDEFTELAKEHLADFPVEQKRQILEWVGESERNRETAVIHLRDGDTDGLAIAMSLNAEVAA